MKQLIKISDNEPRLLQIFYDLGNTCNYQCWYCFPDSNSGTVKWPDADVIKHNIVHVVNYYLESGIVDDVAIYFLGGEPTLWSRLHEVLKFVKENSKCKICVLTNGSRTLRWWEEYGQYFDNVGISVHHERADPAHIIAVSEILHKKGVFVYNDVMMDPNAWDKCVRIIEQLKTSKKRWVVMAKTLHINGVTSYSEDQHKYLKNKIKRYPSFSQLLKLLKLPRKKFTAYYSNGSKKTTSNDAYFRMGSTNFNGWECNLGVNYLWIGRDGLITGTCRQKLYGLVEYFNMNDPLLPTKFSPTIQPVICEQTNCLCGGEISLPKRRL